jgi:hypothetical protein
MNVLNTSVAEQSAEFGQRSFSVIFGLQSAAFERLQKLTQLNLAAVKATLNEAQDSLSSGQPTSTAFTASAGLSQQFVDRGAAYAQHVQEIEAKFQGAVIQAGHSLYEQGNAMWAQVAGSFGGGEPFGSNALIGAMEPVISAINHSLGVMHESFRYAKGAPFGERNLIPVEA